MEWAGQPPANPWASSLGVVCLFVVLAANAAVVSEATATSLKPTEEEVQRDLVKCLVSCLGAAGGLIFVRIDTTKLLTPEMLHTYIDAAYVSTGDYWGRPRLITCKDNLCTIRSSGPDRKRWTKDDVVTTINRVDILMKQRFEVIKRLLEHKCDTTVLEVQQACDLLRRNDASACMDVWGIPFRFHRAQYGYTTRLTISSGGQDLIEGTPDDVNLEFRLRCSRP